MSPCPAAGSWRWVRICCDCRVMLSFNQGCNSAIISWRDTNIGETGYLVEACPGSPRCAANAVIRTNLPADTNKVTLGQLPLSQPLYVRVQATGAQASLSSDFAYAKSIVPLPPPPSIPQNTKAEARGFSEVAVSWTYQGARDPC